MASKPSMDVICKVLSAVLSTPDCLQIFTYTPKEDFDNQNDGDGKTDHSK